MAYLGINDIQPTIKHKEVFHVYSHSQHTNLIELSKRLQTEMEHVPTYNTVYQFEQLKFEDTDSVNQLSAKIKYLCMQMEQIQKAQEYRDKIHNYILKYASNKGDTLNQIIMGALIDNKELTLEFCNYIYEICKSREAKRNIPLTPVYLNKRTSKGLNQDKHILAKSLFFTLTF